MGSGVKGNFSEKHGKFILGTGGEFQLCWQTGSYMCEHDGGDLLKFFSGCFYVLRS